MRTSYPVGEMFKAEDRAYFSIVATKLLRKGEEVIVNYGNSYWHTMAEYKPMKKPQSIVDRDSRYKKRCLKGN